MAKILCNYFGLSMAAEGKSEFVGRQAAAFLGYVQQDAERCAANCGSAEDLSAAPEEIKREILRNDEELRRREQPAPGVEHDVVAIYDNAGIPSIMHRFRRVTNKELFGGSDAVHPAFIIGGEVYDEIYISVYENTMINGKPYSLPLQEPVTNITMEEFAQACFSKGEGWHCLTAAEWGLLADISLKLGTLPHGNTNCSHWHGDDKEQGIIIEDSYKTLTGSGPATWTHDHTASGVHDLCGNIWEFARGVRICDGALWAAENNDAALPETDLTECGDGWKPITDAEGHPLYVAVEDNKIQHTDGLTRDVLEQLWADKAGQIGFTRCEYLDVDHGSVESLVRYISKNKRCARSWRQSRGLEKPKTPPPNDTKWSRKKLDEASTLYIDDVAYWERKYPGYTMNRVETRVSNAGWRHTTVIMRRAECWHGTPGRKVTPRMNR